MTDIDQCRSSIGKYVKNQGHEYDTLPSNYQFAPFWDTQQLAAGLFIAL